ncbi:MAG: hypothetical protein RLZ40_1014, partial [Actinomycetota bacterium]
AARTLARRRRVLGVIDNAVQRRPDGKVHFDRCTATFGDDGRLHVRDAGPQGSHQLASTAMANALAVVPDGAGCDAGDTVEVMLLH